MHHDELTPVRQVETVYSDTVGHRAYEFCWFLTLQAPILFPGIDLVRKTTRDAFAVLIGSCLGLEDSRTSDSHL